MTYAGLTPTGTLSRPMPARSVLAGHGVIFAIGALSAIQIANFTVTLLSIACLALTPGFLMMRHSGHDLIPLLLGAIGWISFMASYLVNGGSMLWPNTIAPAAFSVYLIGLTVITDRSADRIAAVLGGIGAGTVVFFLIKGIDLTRTGSFLDLWKYGIAHGVTVLVLFLLTKIRASVPLQSAVLGVIGLASLGLNYRSYALVCLLAAATLFAHHFFGDRVKRVWLFAGTAVVGLLIAYLMPIAARSGLLGPALQRKMILVDATNLPMLMAGRTEPPMSITAIMERPLLGWGSALNLTPDLYTQAEHLAVRLGYPPTFPFDLYWRLPAIDYSAMHSILLGSWAEGGVLAVLLPLWLLVACVRLVWNNASFGRMSPLVLTVALQGIWDLLYDPWTYNMVAEYACIALLFCSLRRLRSPQP